MLLVDDNPADIDLTSEFLRRTNRCFRLCSVGDGVEAVALLHREGAYAKHALPDLVVLDLNLPRKDGRQVLREVKSDPCLARIPVVIFSSSEAASDILGSYELGANSYLRKPGNLADYRAVVESLADFWLGFACLPKKEQR